MNKGVFAVALGLSLASSGCIKKMVLNGTIESTRKAAPALDTVADYELASKAASAGLAQFEGMHRLAPKNEDALFLLTKGWAGYGFAFVEDEYEAAIAQGDKGLARYHRQRAKNAYDRAAFYGVELLSHRDEGFDAAKGGGDAAFRAWLADTFTSESDAPNLFWTAYAWMSRINLMKDDLVQGPALVGDLFAAIAMMERSVALDPDYNNSAGTVALAAFHARSATAGNLPLAQKLFDQVLAKTKRGYLVVQFNYAAKYACTKGDSALYEKLLTEVLAAEDPDPTQRLTNTIAKRRARRWLEPAWAKDLCGFRISPKAAEAAQNGPAEPEVEER